MTSYIDIKRICELCNIEFKAQKTTTRFCSPTCANRAYKARKRTEKIEVNNAEVTKKISKVNVPVGEREYLSVTQAAELIGCSRQNIYHLINAGQLKAVNIMRKKTIIKRTDLDVLLNTESEKPKEYTMSECYTIGEAQQKFGISGKTLYEIIKRNDIPKFQKGKYVYVPKELLDKIFS